MWIRFSKHLRAMLLLVPDKQNKSIEVLRNNWQMHTYIQIFPGVKRIATTLQQIYVMSKDHTSQDSY